MIIDNKRPLSHAVNGINGSSSYLDPASAKDVLKSYQKMDGLSLHELMDSSKVGSQLNGYRHGEPAAKEL